MGCRLLFIFLTATYFEIVASPILIGKSMSHTLRQPTLTRAAVANSKIVKLRSLGPEQLLLTGMRVGTTMVRLWYGSGKETAYTVRVIDPEIARKLSQTTSEGVIKVAMEFMELDLASARELGIKWPTSLEFTGTGQFQGSMNTSGINYSANIVSTKALINFLMQQGFAKTIANPELFVRMGELATFHSGGEIPIPSGSQNFGNFYKKIEWKPYGLSLQVRPSSEDGYRIHSDVKIDISELSRETAVDGIPGLSRKKIETKMDADDGGTVVLSALLKQSSSEKKEGMPFLSSIPIFGSLFSASNQISSEKQLIIAMTFSILNSERERIRLEAFRSHMHD